jgi:hypothetical protein
MKAKFKEKHISTKNSMFGEKDKRLVFLSDRVFFALGISEFAD